MNHSQPPVGDFHYFTDGKTAIANSDDLDEDDGYDEFQDAIKSLVKQYNFSNNKEVGDKIFDSQKVKKAGWLIYCD